MARAMHLLVVVAAMAAALCGTVVAQDPCDNPLVVTTGLPSLPLCPGDMVPPLQVTVTPPCPTLKYKVDQEAAVTGGDISWRVTVLDSKKREQKFDRTARVRDTQPPSMAPLPGSGTANCEPPPAPTVDAIDNCGPVCLNFDETKSLDGEGRPVIHRTWTATDEAGNVATHAQDIIILPSVFSFEVPEPPSLVCALPDDPLPSLAVTATSSCDEAPTVETEVAVNLAAETITWTSTAVDSFGYTATNTVTQPYGDTIAPEFVSFPGDINTTCAVPEPQVPDATDFCGVTLEMSEVGYTDPTNPSIWLVVRTWTATDPSGNRAVRSQTIRVDGGELTLTACETLDLSCHLRGTDEVPPLGVLPTSSCGDDAGVEQFQVVTERPGEVVYRTVATTPLGISAELTVVVPAGDTTPPSFAGFPLDDSTVCDLAEPQLPDVTDNCAFGAVLDLRETSTDQGGGIWRTEREWTATDRSGNRAVRTQVILVDAGTLTLETAAPNLMCHVLGDPLPLAPVSVAESSCQVPVQVIQTPVVDAGDATATYTVVASTYLGNWVSRTLVAPRGESEPPAFGDDFPADANVTCALPPLSVPSVSDNCGIVRLELNLEEATEGAVRVQRRVWSASDLNGNAIERVQTLRLLPDRVSVSVGPFPDLSCRVRGAPGLPELAVAASACDPAAEPVTVTQTADEYDDYVVYTVTATNAFGEQSVRVFRVSANDVTPPAFDDAAFPPDATH